MVTTADVSEIGPSAALSGGEVIDEGGSPVTERGICWAAGEIPTIYDHKTTDGLGPGRFTSQLSGLEGHTRYYVRAYAINEAGTSYGNLLQFTTEPDAVINYTEENGFPVSNVTSLVIDSQDNVWMGTFNGLVRFDGQSWTTFTTADGLPHNRINALALDVEENVWAGTVSDGVVKFDGSTFTHFSVADGLYSDRIYSLYADDDGNILIGTGSNRLTRFDGSSFIHTHINPEAAGPGGHIHAIATGPDGRIWVGSCISGLSVYDGDQWIDRVNNLNVFIRALFADSAGNIWVSSLPLGLFRYAAGEWENFSAPDDTGLSFVYAIAEAGDASLWFGGPEGLAILENEQWWQLTPDDGLPEHGVSALAADSEGHVWAGGARGVSRILR